MNRCSYKLLMLAFVVCFVTSCYQGGAEPRSLEAQPEMKVSLKSPGILSRYDAFYVAPIEVYSIEGDYLRRVDQREVRDLAESLRSKLIRELDSRSTIFPQPAGNVALLKVSLTDVASSYSAFQIAPGMLVPNAMRGGASIDARFVDSVTGEKVAEVRDSRSGVRQGYLSGLGKWDGVERAFDEWAGILAGAIRR